MKKKTKSAVRQPENCPSAQGQPAAVPGEKLRWVALVILLCVICSRMFIGELPFRIQPVDKAALAGRLQPSEIDGALPPVSMLELARVWYPVAIFFAGGLWLAGELLRRKLKISGIVGGTVAVAFVAMSAASCFYAADRRSAEMVWLEQSAMIFGGFVMMQLCRCRQRLGMTLVVLAALGATMGIKGLYEKTVEIPDRIAFFQENRERNLQDQGFSPDSSAAKMFEVQLMSTTPGGYLALSNIFGSSLLLLLPAGLTVGCGVISLAVRQKKSGRLEKGQIPFAAPIGVFCLLACVATAMVLIWTRSRGAIGAAAVTVLLIGVLWRFRHALRRRFATAAIVAVLAVASLVGAVTAYGLKNDSLGITTMTFRWFYWTGGAELIKKHWLTGIGGGNFGDAYLQVRRPEAEEETKTPHNYIIHSLCQFGVFAGGAYVILVGLTVVGAWRSVVKAGGRLEFYLSPSKLGELMFILMLSAVLSRWYFAGMHGILLLVDAIFPAILFGVMIWAFAVQFRSLPMWACSLALAAGVSAFVLHNMVTYSLWSPGTAALFWLTAGAACAAGGRAVEFRKKTVAAAICIWAVMCVFVVAWIVRPVTMRMFFMQKLGEKLCNRDVDWRTAEKAAAADPLDYIAARNVASQIMMELFRNGKTDAGYYRYQQDVLPWLKESQRRNPQNSQSAYYVALLESHFATSGGFDEFSLSIDRAEKLNPSDADFILRLAVLCNIAGRHEKQRELIAHAKELNDRLKKFSPYSTAILPQERFEEASRESDSEKAKQALFPFVIE